MTSIFCVRAGEDDEYADHFRNGNYVAIGWIPNTDLSDTTGEEQIRPLYRAEHGDERSVYQISRFLTEMKAGDIVVTPSQRHEDLYIGKITCDDPSYFYSTEDDDCPYPHRRSVEWRDDPICRSELPTLQRNTVFNVMELGPTQHVSLDQIESEIAASTQRGIEKLADELLLDVGFLKEIEILLNEKPQIIFQGPPGTGKTYVAQKLAEYWAKSPDNVILVQFHPSYAYEDFVQGFRPVAEGSGHVKFELRDGPLVQIANRAQNDPNGEYYLIIDEINRGNIAKVFGELYFLLEYRNKAIRLQYLDESFSLPSNLYIIGTMNTADRTIALVDLALRRRFSFVEFHPDRWPVQGLLRRWLDSNAPDMAWVADLVDSANEKLNDRHAAIGPSYFMKDDLDEDMARRIWKHNVLPYIEEHLFGEFDRLSEFNLDILLKSGTPDGEPDEGIQNDAQEVDTDSNA